jgi:hypothetical protein
MNGEQRRRLALLEARLSAGVSSRVDALLHRDPETLTAPEAVEAWRALCKAPPVGQDQRVDIDDLDEAAALAEWRRLTRR